MTSGEAFQNACEPTQGLQGYKTKMILGRLLSGFYIFKLPLIDKHRERVGQSKMQPQKT